MLAAPLYFYLIEQYVECRGSPSHPLSVRCCKQSTERRWPFVAKMVEQYVALLSPGSIGRRAVVGHMSSTAGKMQRDLTKAANKLQHTAELSVRVLSSLVILCCLLRLEPAIRAHLLCFPNTITRKHLKGVVKLPFVPSCFSRFRKQCELPDNNYLSYK